MAGALLALISAGVRVALLGGVVESTGLSSSSARYELTSGGVERTAVASDGGGDFFTTLGNWITPASLAPGSYEVRATVVSGSVTGTTGSWLALTSSRAWTVSRSSLGTSTATLTIEIRLGTVVLASASVTITANVEPI